MQKVLKNTAFYTIGRMLPQAVNFLLLPVYTAYLPPSEYGIISSLRGFSVILIILFSLSVDRAVNRLFFDYKDTEEQQKYIGLSFGFITVSSSIILVLLFVFSETVSSIYQSIPFYPYFAYFILATFSSVFFQIPLIYLQIKQKGGLFLLITSLQFILVTALTLWYLIQKEEQAAGLLKAEMISNFIALPLFIYISFKISKFNFDYNYLKKTLSKILKYSLPTIPTMISYWILNLSDRIFIENYFDLTEVGIYSIANKIGEIALLFTGALSSAYSPIFYQKASESSSLSTKNKISVFFTSYVLVGIFIVFGIVFFAKELLFFFADESYFEAYKIIPYVALAYLLSIFSGVFNWMIIQEKKTMQMMYIVLASAIINIGLNFMLIPSYGIYGAAIATALSFLVSIIIKEIYARKCYYVAMNYKLILIFFLATLFFSILSLKYSEINATFILLKSFIFFVISFMLYKKYFTVFFNSLRQ